MIINKAYKFRLYPSPEQRQALAQSAGNTRFVWNYFIHKQEEKYQKENKFYFYNEMAAMLPEMKTEFDFLTLGFSQSLQQTLRHQDRALKTFLDAIKKHNTKIGFPKVKKKNWGSQPLTDNL